MRGDMLLLSVRGNEPSGVGAVQIAGGAMPGNVAEEKAPAEEEEGCSAETELLLRRRRRPSLLRRVR